jgi:DNA-directed RNA polymerase specialized sigma24 family protein
MAEQIVDGRVIAACQQGDREAFRVLFEAYKDKVFSIAVYSFGGDASVADDVTQQIFLKLSAIWFCGGPGIAVGWLGRLRAQELQQRQPVWPPGIRQ